MEVDMLDQREEGSELNPAEVTGHEEQLTRAMEQELTDDQLLQMAEGGCSWGANCNNQPNC
jgi:hypothetical protein